MALEVLDEVEGPFLRRVLLDVRVGSEESLLSFLLFCLDNHVDRLCNVLHVVRIDAQNAAKGPIAPCKLGHHNTCSGELLLGMLDCDELERQDTQSVSK